MTTILAEITRGERVESRHRGSVVAVGVDGEVVAAAGDPEQFAFFRSSAKLFQSLPLVESGAADAFGFGDAELAIACGSHDATPEHQRVVARMLTKVGLDDDALRCGFSEPADGQEQARVTLGLVHRTQARCECSGEHAGMLAVCRRLGYPIETYTDRDHPLQQEVLRIVAQALRLDPGEIVLATDGCSLPTFGAPLRAFALAYAALAAPARSPIGENPSRAAALDRLRAAMVARPEMVGGDGVLDTEIMRRTGGRVVAKLGAEGLLCLAVPERALGVAISMEDGFTRGLGPAAVATLDQLGLADQETLSALRQSFSGRVETFRGDPAGEVRPVFRLDER